MLVRGMRVKRFGALAATVSLMTMALTVPRSYGAESRSATQPRTQKVVAGAQYANAPGGTMMLGADYWVFRGIVNADSDRR